MKAFTYKKALEVKEEKAFLQSLIEAKSQHRNDVHFQTQVKSHKQKATTLRKRSVLNLGNAFTSKTRVTVNLEKAFNGKKRSKVNQGKAFKSNKTLSVTEQKAFTSKKKLKVNLGEAFTGK